MTEKRFELKLCNTGIYYVYDNNDLKIPYVDFDKFNKESAEYMVELLNEQHETIIKKDELLSKTLTVNSNYEKCLKEIDDVLSKHNIHTLEKLDQVLTNERTW